METVGLYIIYGMVFNIISFIILFIFNFVFLIYIVHKDRAVIIELKKITDDYNEINSGPKKFFNSLMFFVPFFTFYSLICFFYTMIFYGYRKALFNNSNYIFTKKSKLMD